MFKRPVYDQKLLDSPLWHVELPGHRVCVAENAEGVFLVLFTSPVRAYEFLRRQPLGIGGAGEPTLYSGTRAEFMSRAETSAAGGARGVVVDPQADGGIGGIIEFQVVPPDGPEPAG